VNLDLRASINSVAVDATDAKFKNNQALILATVAVADKNALRIENMLFVEKEISSIFNQFYAGYDAILLFINEKLQLLENKLLAAYPVYRNIMTAVNNTPTKLPPSAAMAGRYAYVDGTRGVWKAPANVDVKSLKSPGLLYDMDDKEQGRLNIDTDSGKSINALRYFVGKGNLIWGARTLAGNDNEWRYVPVRRFFNMVEESCKKSTAWAVFEPNDAGTWVKVKGMIDNFLILQWRAGALQGAKPEDAFYVKVGLGETMTSLDILEGRMNVEIGMAVVRPAEFIILTFSHKLAVS
jgi:phage tail sheath protein FI